MPADSYKYPKRLTPEDRKKRAAAKAQRLRRKAAAKATKAGSAEDKKDRPSPGKTTARVRTERLRDEARAKAASAAPAKAGSASPKAPKRSSNSSYKPGGSNENATKQQRMVALKKALIKRKAGGGVPLTNAQSTKLKKFVNKGKSAAKPTPARPAASATREQSRSPGSTRPKNTAPSKKTAPKAASQVKAGSEAARK